MIRNRIPAPSVTCLEKRYASSQRGGTLIAEQVTELGMHEKLLPDPDGYRPRWCLKCGNGVLHAHDFRERTVNGRQGGPPITIRRYECARCNAIWRVLPCFVARCLWYVWPRVEDGCLDSAEPSACTVPQRTVRRWSARLQTTARMLLQLLATSGQALLEAIAARLCLDASREQLVEGYAQATGTVSGQRLAGIAALTHRLGPGVRLM